MNQYQRISPEPRLIKPYESTVVFWRKVETIIISGKRLAGVQFLHYPHMRRNEDFFQLGFFDRDNIKEAINYFDDVLEALLEWQLGESTKPEINWDVFNNHLAMLDAVQVSLEPKY